jgi:hypothetical protein
LRVRSLVSAESSRLKYVKSLRRLTAELEFLRDENRRGLQYIEQLLSDGRALRQSLSQRERAVCSRESIVRGYLKYIASQQRPRAVCAEVADIDYKPVNLDEYKGLTDPSVGDLDKSRLLCSLIAKIKDVCGDLTRCEEAVNRIEHSLAAILGEARSSRLRRVQLREAEVQLGEVQGKYPYLVALCQGEVRTVDTAYDANIIQDEYTSLERAAIQRDFIAKDLLNLLQILPPESRESLPALASYNVQA